MIFIRPILTILSTLSCLLINLNVNGMQITHSPCNENRTTLFPRSHAYCNYKYPSLERCTVYGILPQFLPALSKPPVYHNPPSPDYINKKEAQLLIKPQPTPARYNNDNDIIYTSQPADWIKVFKSTYIPKK